MAPKDPSLASLSFALGDDYNCDDNYKLLTTSTKEKHVIYIRSLVEWLFFTGQLICNLPERALSSFAEKNPCIRQWVKMPYMYFVGKTDPNSKTDRGTGYTKNWGGAILHKEFSFPKDINDTQIHPLITMDGVWFVLSGFGGSTEILCSFNFETEEEALDDLVNRIEKIRGEVTHMCDDFSKTHGINYGEALSLSDQRKDDWNRYIFDRDVLNKMLNNVLQFYSKDESIFVDHDCYGNFSQVFSEEGFKNIYLDSKHQNSTNEKTKDLVNILSKEELYKMEIKVNIGNPPYTDTSLVRSASEGGCSKSLDDEFFLKSMKNSEFVCKIIRTKHFSKKSSTFRKKLFSSGVVSIEVLPPETFPTISSDLIETCICTWKRGYKGPAKITYRDGTVVEKNLTPDTCINFSDINFNPTTSNNMAYRYERGSTDAKISLLKDGDYPMITTMGSEKDDNMLVQYVDKTQHVSGVNQHGVVMNNKIGHRRKNGETIPHLGQIHVKPYGYAISYSTTMLKTSSEEESIRLVEYLNTEEVKNIVKTIKNSNANSKYIFEAIPDMPVS